MPEDNSSFELPDTLPTGDALTELLGRAEAAFQARYDAGVSTQEDYAELQALAEQVRTVREAVASDTGGEGEQKGEPEGEPEAEPAVEAEPVVEPPAEPVVEPEAAAPSAANAVLDAMLLAPPPVAAEVPAAPATPPVATPMPVPAAMPAASLAPASLAAGGVPADAQLPISGGLVSILASADIPGFGAGTELNGWSGLVDAVVAKARSVPNLKGSRYPVASIQKPLSSERNLDGLSESESWERMQDLSSPSYLAAEMSRVASGGWCAPDETIYSFACLVEAPPDMIDFPTFTTRRGGVSYPISPTFRDFKVLENNGLFTWTEADDISALDGEPTKPCFHIPCVTFDSCRLELEGLCVTAGNLTNEAYPELIQRYLSLVLTAHLHRMNTQKIIKALALVDDSVTIAATFAAASAIFDALLLQVADLRDQFSMSENALIEVAMPRWLRAVARADVARRECCSLDSISNDDVSSFWASAGVRLQFVSNWQELGDPDNPLLVWPTEVDVLMWLPGAIRELTGPKLGIAVARDSVQNATNDYTVAFTEEAYQICKPGCGVRLVTIPICPSGASGERVQLVCAGS